MKPEVTAIIPTRGNVPMEPVVASLPLEWEIIIWDNGAHRAYAYAPGERGFGGAYEIEDFNFMGYGRHAGIEFASGEVIYTQDDDVIVQHPEDIVEAWRLSCLFRNNDKNVHIVANLPEKFRAHYPDSAMLGFGAAYHRNVPPAVLSHFLRKSGLTERDTLFLREADRALTVLSPFLLVDVEKEDREFASDPGRLWKQTDHVKYREDMLELARKVRDES